MSATPRVPCRICRAATTNLAGTVEYLDGFPTTIYDCSSCGCRFTPHDTSIHQQMHIAPAISYYLEYRELAKTCQGLFDGRDLEGLERTLRESAKYAFVIDRLKNVPSTAKLLELGSSRGYLTSYFILSEKDVLGVDMSSEAVAAARTAFGDHFAVAGSGRAEGDDRLDAIYHVGTIGCVADPVSLTTQLLKRLKPGGRLLFNAPNRAALRSSGQLWFDSAPPPELNTLFPEGFFTQQFSKLATVKETVDVVPAVQSFAIGLRPWLGYRWRAPRPKPLFGEEGQVWAQPSTGVTALAERAINRMARMTGLVHLARSRPAEYGLFVEMEKKA